MTTNGQIPRSMSVRSFAEAMKVNQSQESLIPNVDSGSTQTPAHGSAPPVPKIPSIYDGSTTRDHHPPHEQAFRRSSTSSFALELPVQTPPTPPGETPRLRGGLTQQATYVPNADVMSMKASVMESERASRPEAKHTIKRKPLPKRGEPSQPKESAEIDEANKDWAFGSTKTRPVPSSWSPPPTPTRPDFPGDVFEPRHLTTAEQSEPTTRPSTSKGGKPTKTDPYHRGIHDAYPHVFKPKPRQEKKPKLKRNESSRTFETASNFVKGLKKTAKGSGAHRGRKNKRKSGVGVSLSINGSLHDFHPTTHGQNNILHADLKAAPICEAQNKVAGNPGLASANAEPVKPRKVKVVGHADRGTVFGDFVDPKIFDSSSEESVEVEQPRPSSRRNRGLSKPLPDLPFEALNPNTDRFARPSPIPDQMPRSLRGEIPNRKSSRVPSPHDSVLSTSIAAEQHIPAIPPGWEKTLSHPRPNKRVDTSNYQWLPGRDCQKGEKYESIRSGVDYPEIVDCDAEDSVDQALAQEAQPPRRPTSRPPGLDIDPTTPVDWDRIHNGVFPSGMPTFDPEYHANVEMPRFDDESPTPDELFAGVTDEELSRARRQAYLDGTRAKNRTRQQPQDDQRQKEAAVGQFFDGIDKLVNANEEVPNYSKPWFNDELHRMNGELDRERRASDGSIIIDMFPHDAHTSWRATERTDDYTIHSDYRRFTREAYEHGDGQDSAGLLMEKLSRQMHGR